MFSFYAYCINEWIEVSEEIYKGWTGPRAYLADKEELVMTTANGWKIKKEEKTYGDYVQISLGERKLEINLAPNPAGIQMHLGAKLLDKIFPSRKNADLIGFQLERLFETIEQLCHGPEALIEIPYSEDLDDDDLPEMEPTVISKVPSSPFA